MTQSLPKSARLLRRRQFQQVMQHGSRASSSTLFITLMRRPEGATRLGVTVSRKFGKAHERNRFKRLVREAFRLCRRELPSALDLNVLPGHGAQNATLDQIRSDLMRLLTREKRPPQN